MRLRSPSLLRTVEPSITAAEGRRVLALRRLGKRIVLALEDELFLVREPLPEAWRAGARRLKPFAER